MCKRGRSAGGAGLSSVAMCSRGGADEGSILFALNDERDELFDFCNSVRRESLNFLKQLFCGGHSGLLRSTHQSTADRCIT
jgi:hypothetical protein